MNRLENSVGLESEGSQKDREIDGNVEKDSIG